MLNSTKMKHQHYPCMCEAAELILFLCRIFGVAPIACGESSLHGQKCKFKISQPYKIYGHAVQAFYSIFAIVLPGIRIWCGPTISNTRFWYVMTIGHVVGDLNAMACMLSGSVHAEKLCKLLENLASLNGSVTEMRNLKKLIRNFVCCVTVCYIITFISYVYVAYLRNFAVNQFFDDYCDWPDYPFAVIVRGGSLIFPGIQHLMVTFLCLVINSKFKHLMEKTDLTVAVSANIAVHTKEVPNSVSSISLSKTLLKWDVRFDQDINLGQLARDHKQISFCLKELNVCCGLQLLVTTSSVLYTTIYSLYRYSLSSRELVFSNTNERIHYVVGACYRLGHLLHYMYLGRQIHLWYQAPLNVLQNSDLLNLPYKTQQQVQTLLLQWSGKSGYLSAWEVINMGPWLLAPIVGNVITYLLVALQFENGSQQLSNVTAPMILEAFL